MRPHPMSASLTAQLATRLGISEKEAERALQAYISGLQEEIRKTGQAEIPGLGIFRRDGDTLIFAPAPALEIAANYRFAGMPTLPVSPELPKPEADEPPGLVDGPEPSDGDETLEPDRSEEEVAQSEQSVAEDAFGTETPNPEEPTSSAAEEAMAEESSREPFVEAEIPEETEEESYEDLFVAETYEETIEIEEEEVWKAPEEDASHPLGPLPEPEFEEADYDFIEEESEEEVLASESGEKEPQEAFVPESGAEEEDTSIFNVIHFDEEAGLEEPESVLAEEAEEPPDEPSEAPESDTDREGEEEVLKRTVARAETTHRRVRPSEEPNPKRLLYVAIGIVAILAGAFLAYQLMKPSATEPETPVMTEVPPTVDSTQAAASVPPDTSRAMPSSQPERPPQRTLGGIDRSAGGWTVIVASETSREAAEAAAQPYLDLGLPVDVLTGVSGGTTRYRVGVGQFPSQAEAQAAIERLGDRLPKGAWPLRITPNM